ncbi:hypothetical protein CPAR01_02209 [Colletotrichum paranaense]|uniref:Uncharacterized protein n=1 Tax=Colletotrichum paranaense TaxID=1914294 RepID=A0ABQ9SYV6_9PEZI|nr:uncharacterized protein CPAR01_02209 [Colletotrichum paranaense]KAK1544707.1 hypothetical protein CPAR01_02209 [Colletotrichum paranaense]
MAGPPSDQGPANRKGKESAETSKTAKQRATDSTDTDQLQRFSANPRLDLSTNFNPKLDMIGDLLFPSSASGGLPSNPTDKAMRVRPGYQRLYLALARLVRSTVAIARNANAGINRTPTINFSPDFASLD